MNNHLAVVSSYPPSGSTHHKKLVGVASYAKNTLVSLAQADPNLKITVLAENLSDKSDQSDSSSITVNRVWQRNSFLTFPKLLMALISSPAKTVMIQLELAMFGEMVYLLPFPLFLVALVVLGKKPVIVLHQVITDINEMHGHIDLQKNSIRATVLNFCIHLFYRVLGAFSSKIIVFEEVFKTKLSHYVSEKKIVVIPHGVESFPNPEGPVSGTPKSPNNPNSPTLLSFGFLAWYKGTDLLLEQYATLHKEVKLVLAGGPNPNHENKPFYQDYINKVKQKAQELGVTVTGFVPEEKISDLFNNASVVILPYRTLMSSSGPLSLAFSFGKPFLLSESLRPITQTADMQKLLTKHKLEADDLVYTTDTLKEKISNKKLLEKLAALSQDLAKSRSWSNIGKLYYEEIYS